MTMMTGTIKRYKKFLQKSTNYLYSLLFFVSNFPPINPFLTNPLLFFLFVSQISVHLVFARFLPHICPKPCPLFIGVLLSVGLI